MSTATPLTEDELRQFVVDWFDLLDVHAPVEWLLPLVAADDLEMVFPEATVHGRASFEAWYTKVTNRFFDEVHTLTAQRLSAAGDRGEIGLDLNWQAKMWQPPAATSTWLGFDVRQTWEMRRSARTGKAEIVRYVVSRFDPMPGSAPLPD
jgi:hypothetical protein